MSAFADFMNIDGRLMRRYIKGDRAPTIAVMVSLAAALRKYLDRDMLDAMIGQSGGGCFTVKEINEFQALAESMCSLTDEEIRRELERLNPGYFFFSKTLD